VLGAHKLSLTKKGYMRLEEHQLLLASQLKSLHSDAIKALKSLSYVMACILELCEQENTRKRRANKVSGLLNSSNAIEKSKA